MQKNIIKEIIITGVKNYARAKRKKLDDILKVELNGKRTRCRECEKIPKEFIVLSSVLPLKKSLFICPLCGAPFVAK